VRICGSRSSEFECNSVPVIPVGRAAQAAACKAAEAGVTPARDSISPGMSVERHTLMAVRKDLPNRNTGRATLMPVHFPNESGLPTETRTVEIMAGRQIQRLGILSRREHRCRPGLHRPGCGGSTPPSCRVRVASIAAMQRSLKPQSTGQHRGDPPDSTLP